MKVLIRLFLLLTILIFNSTIFAQSGKITGKVIDAKTKEELPFVNIIILETSMGAATDLNGIYNILNVRPGTYQVRASAIGYNSITVQNVRVSIDLTTRIDFELSEQALELGEDVIVVATKPLVTKDLTSSTAIIGADEIANLPVTEFQEVLQLKAGFVGGKVRGGRSGEVVYAIDGVPVTDVYDGSTVVDVNANSIQELQFVSGAFNAEYGKALSGYVNIATKDGDNNFTGNLTTYFGDYYSSRSEFRNLKEPKITNIRNFEASLSGPIIPNLLYFYANARFIYFNGWLNGQKKFNPWDITINNGSDQPLESRYTIQQTGSNEIVPMNWNEKIYGQGKLTYRPFTALKLNFNYILDNVDYKDYNHFFMFNPDGDFQKFRRGNTNILGLTHTLGSTTFYQANFSYFFKSFRQFVYEDPSNPLYTHDALLGQQPSDVPSVSTGGTQSSHFKRVTSSLGFKFDITSQLTNNHQVKAGVELNMHNLTFNNVNLLQPDGVQDPQITLNPFVTRRVPDANNPNENLAIDLYERKPMEFSAYIQDKIELNEMIINLGLRFDYFKPDGRILTDPTDPDIYRPRKQININKTLEERRTYWYKDAEAKIQLSPRLGVAFPITDKAVIHFSYGHFFQIPNFDLLYTNPEFKFGQGTGNLGIAGNPDLKPQETVSGEIGLQQALTDELTIDLTGYFRDIRNLAGTRADEIVLAGSGKYSQYVNSDFGFVKGIVFTLSKRFSNNWAATIDYTLQSAKGNASDPAATRNQIVGGERPEVQLIRLDGDQTHTVNMTFSYSSRDNWGFSFIGTYGSGFPYTPSQSLNISALLTNSELKPTTTNVDFRAYKDFQIADNFKLSVFARIYNIFDIRNQLNVYGDSGSADFTLDEFLRRQENRPELVNTLDEFYRIPTFYSEPRRIEIGTTLFF